MKSFLKAMAVTVAILVVVGGLFWFNYEKTYEHKIAQHTIQLREPDFPFKVGDQIIVQPENVLVIILKVQESEGTYEGKFYQEWGSAGRFFEPRKFLEITNLKYIVKIGEERTVVDWAACQKPPAEGN